MAALSQEPYSTRMQIAHLEGITQNTLPNGETEPQFNGLHDRAHRTAVMLFKENILSAQFWNGISKRQMVSGMTYLLNGKTLAKSAHDVTLSPFGVCISMHIMDEHDKPDFELVSTFEINKTNCAKPEQAGVQGPVTAMEQFTKYVRHPQTLHIGTNIDKETFNVIWSHYNRAHVTFDKAILGNEPIPFKENSVLFNEFLSKFITLVTKHQMMAADALLRGENQILLVVIYSLSIPSIVMVDVPICGALVTPVAMCTNVLNCYQASFLGLDKRMMFPTMNPSVFLNGLFKRFELTCDNHLCINEVFAKLTTAGGMVCDVAGIFLVPPFLFKELMPYCCIEQQAKLTQEISYMGLARDDLSPLALMASQKQMTLTKTGFRFNSDGNIRRTSITSVHDIPYIMSGQSRYLVHSVTAGEFGDDRVNVTPLDTITTYDICVPLGVTLDADIDGFVELPQEKEGGLKLYCNLSNQSKIKMLPLVPMSTYLCTETGQYFGLEVSVVQKLLYNKLKTVLATINVPIQ